MKSYVTLKTNEFTRVIMWLMYKLKSYAKLNLGLDVVGKREDGYHLLKTVFQTIDLCDEIEIIKNDIGKLRLSGNKVDIKWDSSNIISKVARKMKMLFDIDIGFDIRVVKNIPAGSGLGGGSSNGAVILMFLNMYYNLNLELSEMIDIGVKIGADIPFFFLGGTVLAEGVGEELTELPELKKTKFALLIPEIIVSTALIFSKLNLTNTGNKSKISLFLDSGDIEMLENVLEEVTFEIFPDIKGFRDRMLKVFGNFVRMSGSGSSLFSMINDVGVPKSIGSKELLIVNSIDRTEYKKGIGAWPSGKAPVFGAGIRRFESSRPR